ncbi:DUF3916 domain-containing protein [Domibacillus indicus]|uniref:DUF3916 domain-containing protein n=1 Tax=Domibacillus indicus TaxID=1437523 RepID=UPI000617FF18|nr:DUF3916 domain-containing protein [Domibacillus indicus]
MRVKKVRGMKRKTENMMKRIEESTMEFPSEFYKGYWHLHLPADQDFINSHKTPCNVKRLCIQALIDRTNHLMEIKPDSNEKLRAAACITFPHLWDSQIIVFKGDRHFQNFFNRNDDFQRWIPLAEERNLAAEWELSIPSGMKVKGFKEEVIDDEEEACHTREIWFIGELI